MTGGYYDWLLGKFGEMPDDPEALQRGLRAALHLIGSYELDCRNIGNYVTPKNMGRGFCQGTVYQHGVADIFAAMTRETVT